jgi:phosphocarrier protein FPr
LGLKLYSPVDGAVLAIERVPDPVFAQKLVGDGVAVDPTGGVLVAPCDGRITQLHPSHHAVTIDSNEGIQILLHIGLDTVQLKGEGFAPKVKSGDKVRLGQPLIEFDADTIATAGKSLITVMVVTNGSVRVSGKGIVHAAKDVLAEAELAGDAPSTSTAAASTRAESPALKIQLATGLHARPAAQIVTLAKSFSSEIRLHKSGKAANAKSVVGVMGLEIAFGDTVHFSAEGDDAKSAVSALHDFLSRLEEKPAAEAPARGPVKASADPNVIAGIGVSPGLAIGRVQQIRERKFNIPEKSSRASRDENAELGRALHQAAGELGALREKVKAETDAARAAIFSAHLELLEDPDLLESAWQLINQGKTAAFAWNETIQSHAERLAHLNNELMAQRANDLRDVGQRVLRALLGDGADQTAAAPASGVILIAENLTPSQTVQLDREKVLGFCTTQGGSTSHVAILARSLGLPAIAGIDPKALELAEGTEIILDGDKGILRLSPGDAEKAAIRQAQEQQRQRRQAALNQAAQPAVTRDGRLIEVAANIGSLADAEEAMANGADGVGLLRSEFLFLERDSAPTEDEQLAIYQAIAERLGRRPLIIRTLDVGGDKPLQYLPLEKEENPFLGIRGIRIGLLHENILRTQLRAILRVRSQARLHIMFPMVATLEDLLAAKRILNEERQRLNAPEVAVGIMVEVPSVALMAGTFAPEVDFFSVGTNDLTQYTLAMDRGHKDLAKQADALHPSVLKLIEMTCEAAKRHGKWVGVCGGLAGDHKAVNILVGLGVKELSVSIPSVPLIKAQVRELTTTEAETVAKRALTCRTAKEVRQLTSVESDGKPVASVSQVNMELN